MEIHCIYLGLFALLGALGHFLKGFMGNTNSEIIALLKNTWISKMIWILSAFALITYQCMTGHDMTVGGAIMAGYIAFSLSEAKKPKALEDKVKPEDPAA